MQARLMKDNIEKTIAYAVVAAGFVAVSFLVWITRRHPYWVRKKLSIGALLLSLTAFATTNCYPARTCYVPRPRPHISDKTQVALSPRAGPAESVLRSIEQSLRMAGFEVERIDRAAMRVTASRKAPQAYRSSIFVIVNIKTGTAEITATTWSDPQDPKAAAYNRRLLSEALEAIKSAGF
jgi:hypothetical protein